ncbi:hypothetical protein MJH12_04655, partial [bacterium]|nr:hypothetical protein [bacterium]
MVKPKLRENLSFSPQSLGGKKGYTLKDPDTENYYRFSEEEYQVACLVDGTRDLKEIQENCLKLYDIELDMDDIQDFLQSLKQMDLMVRSKEEQNLILIERRKASRQSILLSKKGSIMYKRFPIINPDKIFDKMIPSLTFLWSPWFFAISCLFMLSTSILMLYHLTEIIDGMERLWSFQMGGPLNYIILWIVII